MHVDSVLCSTTRHLGCLHHTRQTQSSPYTTYQLRIETPRRRTNKRTWTKSVQPTRKYSFRPVLIAIRLSAKDNDLSRGFEGGWKPAIANYNDTVLSNCGNTSPRSHNCIEVVWRVNKVDCTSLSKGARRSRRLECSGCVVQLYLMPCSPALLRLCIFCKIYRRTTHQGRRLQLLCCGGQLGRTRH